MKLESALATLIDLLKSTTVSDQELDNIHRLYLVAAENASDITRRDFCYSVGRTAEQLFVCEGDLDITDKAFTANVNLEHNTWYIEVKGYGDEYPLWVFYVKDVTGTCSNLEAVERTINNVLIIQELGRKPTMLSELSDTVTAINKKYLKMQQQETDWAMRALP